MLQARLKQLVSDDSAKDDQTGMLTQPTIMYEFVSFRNAPGLSASALQLPHSLLADQKSHKYQFLVYKATVCQWSEYCDCGCGLRCRTSPVHRVLGSIFSCESQLVIRLYL